jgi:hypothetical protein
LSKELLFPCPPGVRVSVLGDRVCKAERPRFAASKGEHQALGELLSQVLVDGGSVPLPACIRPPHELTGLHRVGE